MLCLVRCRAGGWNAPKNPLWGVPLNMTAAHVMWQNMDAAVVFAKDWVYTQHKAPVLGNNRRQQRRLSTQYG